MKLLPVVAALVLVVAFSAAPAYADTACASGSTCTVLLTQTNISQLVGAVVVTVTINNTGATTVLSFQLTTTPAGFTGLGIDQVGWGGAVVSVKGKITPPAAGLISTASTNFGGNLATAVTSGAGTMDGFGSFAVQGADSGGTGGIGTPITFTLAGLITSFPDNNFLGTGAGQGNEFAVHVRFNNMCSSFVGGLAGAASTNSDPNCTVIPEPGTMALFGTGLLGLAAVIRRRLAG